MFKKKPRTKVPERVIRARSDKYKFSIKTHPMDGIISFTMGIVSFIILVLSCYFSWKNRGEVGISIGIIGMLAFFISIVGVVFSFNALQKRDVHLHFPVIGGIVNGVLTILYLAIYAMGTLL